MSEFVEYPAKPIEFPLMPLRDVVVFPHMVVPLFVGRASSIRALEAAMEAKREIVLVTQKNAAQDDPEADDLLRQVVWRLSCSY